MEKTNAKFRFAIDRGGTFTDIYAQCPNGDETVMKLLSVDPQNYDDAPTEGIRRIIQSVSGSACDDSGKVDASKIEWIRMGTTVATNALLERKGERMALVINQGFRDLLFIGNQSRPDIFALDIQIADVLYEQVIEVNCRVVPAQSDRCLLTHNWREVEGTTKEKFFVTNELDLNEVESKLKCVKHNGIDSIAVVMAHSYSYNDHEKQIGEIARKLAFKNISLSHEVMSMARMVPRGLTACVDAYLTPHIHQYLESFKRAFNDDFAQVPVLFMQSNGGLTPMHKFNGSKAILSGPAGGVVGYAQTTYDAQTKDPIIGFDMGGTSTDVSRFDGQYEHVFETVTAGVTIQSPQLDINTVAAGGGSILNLRSGLFVVGPESAGAHPGPACYKKGGPLTVTDANLVLGRLLPEYFPKIFGPNQNEALDRSSSLHKFANLREQVNDFLKLQNKAPMSVEQIAMGFIEVANEAMCRPIRNLTQAKGYETSKHVLACFGGAGGQHACAIAKSLAMKTVFVHKYAGILSAYGMALADVVEEQLEPTAFEYASNNFGYLQTRLDHLTRLCRDKLVMQRFNQNQIHFEHYLHMRFKGTDCALMVQSMTGGETGVPVYGDFLSTFRQKYKEQFGFVVDNRAVIVDDIRVRAIAKSLQNQHKTMEKSSHQPVAEHTRQVFFDDKYESSGVYLLHKLSYGHVIQGPAIIMDKLSAILIEPNAHAEITQCRDVIIHVQSQAKHRINTECDAVSLSIFSHRFMSIAEQMGKVLQRTAMSPNIKERLDFSCALFGADGGLVSNAPHIPVHLGAMQETVQYQVRTLAQIHAGDVILSNHPQAGGSHLPDLTVITPVFYRDHQQPVFFVASRGHHADIGGIAPGSMPPHSTTLHQEGAVFKSFKLVDKGVFQEQLLIEQLMKPALIQGCSGTRNLSENLADLRAQIAANQKGINLVLELIEYYGLHVIQAYMKYIQENAQLAVCDMLKRIAKQNGQTSQNNSVCVAARDYLDNGATIALQVTIEADQGTAVFDFSESSYEMWGNCNAPKAITMSAIIYCLRCMVGHDIPLNQGCLTPIKVIIPEGSMLNPSEHAAVVGGNVLTSQRVVDVILRAFDACAASQGCMNNITFGEESWGYYETVAGGSGAGATWHGRCGVHTHMTNTRITDVEILEKLYPVIVKRFALRANSGGVGEFLGGDGVVRELLFRRFISLSVLTERRVFAPYGLHGGGDGAKGLNLLYKNDNRVIFLPSKTAVPTEPGDILHLETPGGGAYGQCQKAFI